MAPEFKVLSDPDDSVYLMDIEPFAMLINARDIRSSSLNNSGKVLLQEILHNGMESTATKLAALHDLDVTLIRRDLEKFIGELENQGILRGESRSRSPLFNYLGRSLFKKIAGFAIRSKAFEQRAHPKTSSQISHNETALRSVVSSLLGWAWWCIHLLG